MSAQDRPILAAAALSAAIAIMAGAFGAHGAASPAAAGWLQTGGAYQLTHAVAALVLIRWSLRTEAILLLAGSALFAFALYALALGGPRSLGAVAPVGGLIMIAGWLLAAYRFWRHRSEQ